MSVKSFVNSRDGRRGILVAVLALIGIGISGTMLWWLFFLPNLGLGVVDQKTIDSGEANFSKVAVVEEKNTLIGLPSSTLEIIDSGRNDQPQFAFDFAKKAIENSNRESLVNTHSFLEQTEDKKAMSYDFMFYSGSLSDYSDDGAFVKATRQFDDLAAFGTSSIKYISKPISSGGRELKIDLTAKDSFSGNTEESFITSWGKLTANLGEAVKLDDGTRIELTLRDASGAVTLKTVINSPESAATAANISPSLWHTFNLYLFSNTYDFLDAQKISYSIERTSQDSVMTITTGDGVIAPEELQQRMAATVRSSEDGALYPGSFITYVVKNGDPNPLLFIGSSSRNW